MIKRNLSTKARVEHMPLISIIVAVRNGALTLQRCIDSVTDQSYALKELIIIDGKSTDGTIAIIESNSSLIEYWESESDRGVYHAWNKALEHATGDWICFLGADDFFWNANVLGQLAEYLENVGRKTTCVYGRVALVDENDKILMTIGKPWVNLKKKFRQIMCLPHPGLMYHRSIFERNGKFIEKFRIAGDYELLLRELNHRDPVFVPIIVAGMQKGGLSTKPSNVIISLKEMRFAQKMNGINYPGLKWLFGFLAANVKILLYNYGQSKN